MSVYPARNASGSYTGSWTVEVVRKGKRTRATAEDFQTAKRIERALECGEPVPADLQSPRAIAIQDGKERRALYSLQQLRDASVMRWEGTKDAVLSIKRLDTMVRLLGPETPVEHLRYSDLEKATNELARRGYAAKTINRYLATISGALKWARKQGIIDKVPPKPWRKESRGRVVFIPADADALMHGWFMGQGKTTMALVYAVLVSTGLRINELLTLKPDEVDGGWLRLNRTKNGDPRDVPIRPGLASALRERVRQGALPAYETVRRAFITASEETAIGIRVTPHVLRHTAATRLNSAGVPTATIQKFLGHRDMRTTLIYAHADPSALVEAAKHLNGPGYPWSDPEPPKPKDPTDSE